MTLHNLDQMPKPGQSADYTIPQQLTGQTVVFGLIKVVSTSC